MQHFTRWFIVGLVILGLGGIGYLWWQKQQGPALVPITEAPPLESQVPLAQAPETVASAPADYPIEAIAPLEGASAPLPLPPVIDDDKAVSEAVTELLGRDQVLSFLDTTDFARRVVATVDNLGREHAASRLWPVAPAPARFMVVERDGVEYVAGSNGDRYNAFVRFATAIDSGAAVALYVRMYPLLQQAYEDLGYPGKRLNNRVVEVIDSLLQAPEPSAPIALSLVRVKGPIAEKRPWLRYEYADPDLEARPSGQKILMRMGLSNTAALKAKLRDLRKRVAGSAAGR